MGTETQISTRPDGWVRLGRAVGWLFGFLLRLIFVILLAVGLGAGLYFGVPWLYAQWIQPVQTHTTQIALLTDQLETLRASDQAAKAAQAERLTALETANDGARERVAAAEARAADLEAALAAEKTAREVLEKDLAALKTAMLRTTDALTSETQSLSASLATLEPAVASAQTDVQGLQQQVTLLQAQNTLLRARLQVTLENLGEARTLLTQSADEIEKMVASESFDVPAETRAALVNRLAAARGLIQAQPATALTEFEAVWGQLQRAVSPAEPQPAP